MGPRARVAATVAGAVDSVKGVRRSPGSGVPVATQYRGGQIDGVRIDDSGIVVQVVALRLPLDDLMDMVRVAAQLALSTLGDTRPVSVVVDDLEVERLPSGRARLPPKRTQ